MEFIPHLVSWNITRECNLKCKHCYSFSADFGAELNTRECLDVIEQLGEVNPNTFLVLSGGEPLLRNDLPTIVQHAAGIGFTVVIGTNATLVTKSLVEELIHFGVKGIGVSLDSLNPEIHDQFRGLPGAWQATMHGIEILKEAGLDFIIQTTVSSHNYQEIQRIIEFSWHLGAKAFNLFFLVCTGRGQTLTDISPQQYEALLTNILRILEKEGQTDDGKGMINVRCAPHFYRLAHQIPGIDHLIRSYPKGCPAATYYCRIRSDGDVTPCPYLPLSAGNLRYERFSRIWTHSGIFKRLREGILEGRCGRCEYRDICSGCRARAYAFSHNLLAEDPWCLYKPGKNNLENLRQYGRPYGMESENELHWTPDAKEHLRRIPSFVRGMVVKKVEEYARKQGYQEITLEVMKQVRRKSSFPHKPGPE